MIPGLGRAPDVGNGNALHYSCLGSPMDGGAQQAAVHGFAKSETGLSTWADWYTKEMGNLHDIYEKNAFVVPKKGCSLVSL